MTGWHCAQGFTPVSTLNTLSSIGRLEAWCTLTEALPFLLAGGWLYLQGLNPHQPRLINLWQSGTPAVVGFCVDVSG